MANPLALNLSAALADVLSYLSPLEAVASELETDGFDVAGGLPSANDAAQNPTGVSLRKLATDQPQQLQKRRRHPTIFQPGGPSIIHGHDDSEFNAEAALDSIGLADRLPQLSSPAAGQQQGLLAANSHFAIGSRPERSNSTAYSGPTTPWMGSHALPHVGVNSTLPSPMMSPISMVRQAFHADFSGRSTSQGALGVLQHAGQADHAPYASQTSQPAAAAAASGSLTSRARAWAGPPMSRTASVNGYAVVPSRRASVESIGSSAGTVSATGSPAAAVAMTALDDAIGTTFPMLSAATSAPTSNANSRRPSNAPRALVPPTTTNAENGLVAVAAAAAAAGTSPVAARPGAGAGGELVLPEPATAAAHAHHAGGDAAAAGVAARWHRRRSFSLQLSSDAGTGSVNVSGSDTATANPCRRRVSIEDPNTAPASAFTSSPSAYTVSINSTTANAPASSAASPPLHPSQPSDPASAAARAGSSSAEAAATEEQKKRAAFFSKRKSFSGSLKSMTTSLSMQQQQQPKSQTQSPTFAVESSSGRRKLSGDALLHASAALHSFIGTDYDYQHHEHDHGSANTGRHGEDGVDHTVGNHDNGNSSGNFGLSVRISSSSLPPSTAPSVDSSPVPTGAQEGNRGVTVNVPGSSSAAGGQAHAASSSFDHQGVNIDIDSEQRQTQSDEQAPFDWQAAGDIAILGLARFAARLRELAVVAQPTTADVATSPDDSEFVVPAPGSATAAASGPAPPLSRTASAAAAAAASSSSVQVSISHQDIAVLDSLINVLHASMGYPLLHLAQLQAQNELDVDGFQSQMTMQGTQGLDPLEEAASDESILQRRHSSTTRSRKHALLSRSKTAGPVLSTPSAAAAAAAGAPGGHMGVLATPAAFLMSSASGGLGAPLSGALGGLAAQRQQVAMLPHLQLPHAATLSAPSSFHIGAQQRLGSNGSFNMFSQAIGASMRRVQRSSIVSTGSAGSDMSCATCGGTVSKHHLQINSNGSGGITGSHAAGAAVAAAEHVSQTEATQTTPPGAAEVATAGATTASNTASSASTATAVAATLAAGAAAPASAATAAATSSATAATATSSSAGAPSAGSAALAAALKGGFGLGLGGVGFSSVAAVKLVKPLRRRSRNTTALELGKTYAANPSIFDASTREYVESLVTPKGQLTGRSFKSVVDAVLGSATGRSNGTQGNGAGAGVRDRRGSGFTVSSPGPMGTAGGASRASNGSAAGGGPNVPGSASAGERWANLALRFGVNNSGSKATRRSSVGSVNTFMTGPNTGSSRMLTSVAEHTSSSSSASNSKSSGNSGGNAGGAMDTDRSQSNSTGASSSGGVTGRSGHGGDQSQRNHDSAALSSLSPHRRASMGSTGKHLLAAAASHSASDLLRDRTAASVRQLSLGSSSARDDEDNNSLIATETAREDRLDNGRAGNRSGPNQTGSKRRNSSSGPIGGAINDRSPTGSAASASLGSPLAQRLPSEVEGSALDGMDRWDFDILEANGRLLAAFETEKSKLSQPQQNQQASSAGDAGAESTSSASPTLDGNGGRLQRRRQSSISDVVAGALSTVPIASSEMASGVSALSPSSSLSLGSPNSSSSQLVPSGVASPSASAIPPAIPAATVHGVGAEMLVALTCAALERTNTSSELQLDPGVTASFIARTAQGYNNSQPYHNALHAADVTQGVYFLLSTGGLGKKASPAARLALILSAACHDVGHPGLNNGYLCTVGHPLALTYNDRSPLENMHVATAFLTMRKRGCDVLACLNPETRLIVRQLMIACVLGTDNAHHFKLVSKLQRRLRRALRPLPGLHAAAGSGAGGGGDDAENVDEYETDDDDDLDHDDDDQLNSPSHALVIHQPFDLHSTPTKLADSKLLLSSVLHACDIANPSRPWHLTNAWGAWVNEEFHRQGEAMTAAGLVPLPLMFDRQAASAAGPTHGSNLAAGFMTALVLPLWNSLADPVLVQGGVLDVSEVVKALKCNLGRHLGLIEEGKKKKMALEAQKQQQERERQQEK